MALAFNINTLVYKKLPFLVESSDTTELIELFKIDAISLVAEQLPHSDPFDETAHSKLETTFLAELTAMELLKRKILENTGGSAGADSSSNRIIKKTKADVVEAEFEIVKPGVNLTETASMIAGDLKKSICQKASILDISLPMCEVTDSTGGIFLFETFDD